MDVNFLAHGFVRAADGKTKTFEAPGAGEGTVGLSVSAAGDITGFYVDSSAVYHGFMRTP
jgi:hypothetical protein